MGTVDSDMTYEEIIGAFCFILQGGQLDSYLVISPGDLIDGPINPDLLPRELISIYFAKLRKGNVTLKDAEALRAFLAKQKVALEHLERFVQWYGNMTNVVLGYRQIEAIEAGDLAA